MKLPKTNYHTGNLGLFGAQEGLGPQVPSLPYAVGNPVLGGDQYEDTCDIVTVYISGKPKP